MVGVVGQRGADARVAQAPQRRPDRRPPGARAAARRRRAASAGDRLARAHERERHVGLAQRGVQAAGSGSCAEKPTAAACDDRRSAMARARSSAPARSPGSSASTWSPRRRTRPPGRDVVHDGGSARARAAGRAATRRATAPAARSTPRPPGARDERLGLHGGAAQVLEQGAGGPRPVGVASPQRGQGERCDRGEAQDGLGARRGRAAVVEQHDGADLLAVGAHRGVGHVALGQRPGLPGQPRGDEAPDGGQAALAARPGHRGADRGQDDGRRSRRWPRRVSAAMASRPSPVEDGVGHPPAALWRGGAHRARWRRTTTCRTILYQFSGK